MEERFSHRTRIFSLWINLRVCEEKSVNADLL